MANEIREPKQSRSIEKKNKIILAGYKLFAEVGYHSTTTPDIAKEAKVSTGIVYGYFKDKRDILISVLDIYMENVTAPIFELLDNLKSCKDIKALANKLIDRTIKIHKDNTNIHQVLHSLSSTDTEVNKKFMELEDKITMDFAEKLKGMNMEIENVAVKVHMAMNLIQSISHEIVYDNHDYIDYLKMREYACKMIANLFEN